MLLAVSALNGLGGIVSYQQVASNAVRVLPDVLARAYYYGLTASALLAFVGVMLRSIRGPLIERAGLWLLGGLWGAYGAIVATTAWPRGFFVSIVLLGFAAANVWRAMQIRGELKRIRAAAAIDQRE
jgi:hypothetical protein